MAVELPPLGRGEAGKLHPARAVDHQGKGARAPGKGDCMGQAGMGGRCVPSGGQGQAKDAVPSLGQPMQFVRASGRLRGRKIRGASRIRPAQAGGHGRCCE